MPSATSARIIAAMAGEEFHEEHDIAKLDALVERLDNNSDVRDTVRNFAGRSSIKLFST